LDNLFTAFNNKISALEKTKLSILIVVLTLSAAGSLVGSLATIKSIEIVGILLGSLSGAFFLSTILMLSNIFLTPRLNKDIRHNFAITTRRKIAAVVAGVAIISAAASGDGENPIVGAALIVLIGLLGIFISTTEAERTAISEMEDEIVWRYENETESDD
jgi:hypothetical protein